MSIATGIKSFFSGGLAAMRGNKAPNYGGSQIVRAGMTLGPWDAMLHTFVPQLVNPYFYEGLRRAIPLIEGGINCLVLLDGIVRFDRESPGIDKGLADELTAAMAELPVDDGEIGLQSYYEIIGNEIYEQGFAQAERLMAGRKLKGIRTADSKGLLARRNENGEIEWFYRPPAYELATRRNGTDYTEVVLRNNIVNVTPGYLNQLNYVQLDPSTMVYNAFRPESNNPYGVSVLRSVEFVSQILLRMQNATGRVWDRFGDPSFQIKYKTKNRALKQADLDKRVSQISADLANVLSAKRNGNSGDLAHAIGADDDITLDVIGGNGHVIDLKMPANHMVEQILAKLRIPGWMLGLSEAQAGRMADQQSEMVLMESKVRFERRIASLKTIVTTWLRGEGITWKPGAWNVVQELPNLRDVQKMAQARFLNAQADMMASGVVNAADDQQQMQQSLTGIPPALGGDPNQGKTLKSIQTRVKKNGSVVTELIFNEPKHARCAHAKAAGDDAEPWAEPDPLLPGIEASAVDGLLKLWAELQRQTVADLGVLAGDASGAAVWRFDAGSMLSKLLANEQAFIAAAGAVDGPLIYQAFQAFVRGLENAASEFDAQVALDAYRESIRVEVATRGMQLVKDAAARTYRDGILEKLGAGAFDGENPMTVARKLASAFDLGNYDWVRLARSEIARAQSHGKLREYRELGVTQVDWFTASQGVCPICTELGEGGPYDIATAPVPVDDSHPNCFPAATTIWSPRLIGSAERWYEGELVEIVTASGVLLSGTPNHPVLTPQGWIPFNCLREGDDVIRCLDAERAMALVCPDDYHGPALIEDAAITLGTTASVAAVTVPSSAKHFHGDGMHADVEIVEADSLLHGDVVAALAQQASQRKLVGVDSDAAQLASLRAPFASLIRFNPSARRAVCGADKATPFIDAGLRHTQIQGFAAPANSNSGAAKIAMQSRAANADAFGEGFEALSGLITCDRILEIRKRDFSGHVYNLETSTGWYVAEGVIVHNCRCTVLAVDPAAPAIT